jgi:hypothetical protein
MFRTISRATTLESRNALKDRYLWIAAEQDGGGG